MIVLDRKHSVLMFEERILRSNYNDYSVKDRENRVFH